MGTIADSSAVAVGATILAQHQAAVTLLQGRLSTPTGTPVNWLDLACGRGQIVSFLRANLSDSARGRLSYSGFDIDHKYVRQAEKLTNELGLLSKTFQIGPLSQFSQLFPTNQRFDFITLTNTVHEVGPTDLATVLVDAVLRLSPEGTLFIYDMEVLPEPELGAVPWRREEAEAIVWEVLSALGSHGYHPEVGQWHHRSCTAWNAHLHRQHLGVNATQALHARTSAITSVSAKIKLLLEVKAKRCVDALEGLTRFGAETQAEEQSRIRWLYENWAVQRALGVL
jgi:SAM-dependent methyltransferase